MAILGFFKPWIWNDSPSIINHFPQRAKCGVKSRNKGMCNSKVVLISVKTASAYFVLTIKPPLEHPCPQFHNLLYTMRDKAGLVGSHVFCLRNQPLGKALASPHPTHNRTKQGGILRFLSMLMGFRTGLLCTKPVPCHSKSGRLSVNGYVYYLHRNHQTEVSITQQLFLCQEQPFVTT